MENLILPWHKFVGSKGWEWGVEKASQWKTVYAVHLMYSGWLDLED